MNRAGDIVDAATNPWRKPWPPILAKLPGGHQHIRFFRRMTVIGVADVRLHDRKAKLKIGPFLGAAWAANRAVRMALQKIRI